MYTLHHSSIPLAGGGGTLDNVFVRSFSRSLKFSVAISAISATYGLKNQDFVLKVCAFLFPFTLSANLHVRSRGELVFCEIINVIHRGGLISTFWRDVDIQVS